MLNIAYKIQRFKNALMIHQLHYFIIRRENLFHNEENEEMKRVYPTLYKKSALILRISSAFNLFDIILGKKKAL